MDKIVLSEFKKLQGFDVIQVYFKKLADVDGLVYDYNVVFGKSEGSPYTKVPLIKGIILIIDKNHRLHQGWWNEQGYHINTDNLPRYEYFLGIISITESSLYSTAIVSTNLGSLKPFFGDIIT